MSAPPSNPPHRACRLAALLCAFAGSGGLGGLPSSALAGSAPPPGTLPAHLVTVATKDEPRCVLITEKSTQRLYVWECSPSGATLLETLPCTTGRVGGDKQVEGDLRTPEGVYWFTRYIPGEALPPLYGAGAYVMDYPNHFDRLDEKTGYGIWLHGVEADERVRVANDTRGCVAVRNGDFDGLRDRSLRLHDTPIVVVETVSWERPEQIADRARAVHDFLDEWRAAWEDERLSAYLSLYGGDFRSEGMDLDEWARHKESLAERYGVIRIGIDDVVALAEKDRLWIRFRQEYVSDGHRDVGTKTLFVKRPSADWETWRIVGEEWQPLAEDFELLDPDAVTAPLTMAQLAVLAPDAASANRPDVPFQPRLEEAAAPAPAATGSEAPEEPAIADEPEPTAVATPAAATPEAGASPPEAGSPASIPAEPEPARRPAIDPRTLQATVRLEGAETDRGRFRLHAPHVRPTPDGLSLAVQLLNERPHSLREGRVAMRAILPEGAVAELPGTPGEDASGRHFRTRQGELLQLVVPVTREMGTVPVHVEVRDDTGRVVLEQVIVLAWSARSVGSR